MRPASGDARARRYALRSVRPSPARLEAPEPHVWLPILDLTEELDALDLNAELETLDLDDELETIDLGDLDRGTGTLGITEELELLVFVEGQDDLARELEAIEAGFWRAAEAEHPFLTGELPVTRSVAPEVVAPVPAPDARADAGAPVGIVPAPETVVPAEPTIVVPPATAVAPAVTAPSTPVAHAEPDPLQALIPAAYASVRPNRPAIVHRKRALRMRRRIIVTVLVTAVAAACAGVTARVLGGTRPQRDVTVSIDGRANTVVTRAGTVSDLLAAGGVVLHDGDRVFPSLSTQLRQGMPIRIQRAFPIVVDVDGKITERRTTRHTLAGIRRELGLPAAMVRVGGGNRIDRRARIVMRTPHDVTVIADGATTPVAHSTALTVAELLASRKIALGAQDEVTPALETRLAPGLAVQVFRLLPDQVVDVKVIPFTTEYRDDPNLARGHTNTIQAGKNGTARVVSNVVKKDGVIVQWTEVSNTVITPAVPQILARGTKPSGTQQAPPAPASGGRSIGGGYATWYKSHAGPGACAHLTLPFGTIVKLVADSGRTAQCRVGDRGPEAWTGNIIDLNPDVFAQLAPLGTGRIHVSMYIVG